MDHRAFQMQQPSTQGDVRAGMELILQDRISSFWRTTGSRFELFSAGHGSAMIIAPHRMAR